MKRFKKWINRKFMTTQKSQEAKSNHGASLDWRLEGLDDGDRIYLEERMNPDFGLLDKLVMSSALTRREANAAKSQATFEARNAKLLDYIAEKKRFGDLADALLDTRQTHLLNYLDSHGVYDSSFGGEWPLTDRQTKILDLNHEFLVDKLETMDLVGNLESREIINGRQRELLAAKQTTYEKGEMLVDILRRGSLNGYRTTIECLHETNQSHIAQVLDRGGVVVSVHAHIQEEDDEEAKEVVRGNQREEEELVDEISRLLVDRSPSDSSRIWELVQLRLVGVEVGRSVVLFFHCRTTLDLDEMQLSYTNGHLRLTVERVFHRLLGRAIRVQINAWTDDEFAEIRNQFLSLSDLQKTTEKIPQQLRCGQSSITSSRSNESKERTASDTDRKSLTTGHSVIDMSDLPFELLEMILEKSCLLNLTNRKKPSYTTNEVFVRMASVESFWLQLIRRPKFQRTLIRHLSIVYRQLSRRSRIIGCNRVYLVGALNSVGSLVERMRLIDCLSDKQMRCLNRLKDHRRRNEELLSLVKAFDASRTYAFVRCLREDDGQRLPARIVESGGAVLKARVRSGNTERQRRGRDWSLYLIQRINELLQKLKPLGEEAERLLKQLKSGGCEIHAATEDKGIVIWIWVQSQLALATLMTDDANRGPLSIVECLLTQLCRSSYWNQGPIIGRRGTVVVDGEQLRTEIVTCPIVPRLLKRIDVTSYIHGIVTLNDHLYVLCHQPNNLRVYESRSHMFAFQREIPLQTIVEPWDMGASVRSNCLYVTDSHKRCVWKIQETLLGGGHQVVTWLHDVSSLQFTLSVTSDDEVLMVTGGTRQLPRLDLYTPDAQLTRSIRLPSHVFSPVHAVACTSSGLFVVIYGWWNSKRWGICQLNSEGEMVRQLTATDDSQQLNWPWHLALDDDDRVFVADYENNRVIVLDSDLSWLTILLRQNNSDDDDAGGVGGGGLTEPWRLFYSRSQKMLTVAHLHKVDIYAVTQT